MYNYLNAAKFNRTKLYQYYNYAFIVIKQSPSFICYKFDEPLAATVLKVFEEAFEEVHLHLYFKIV